MHQDDDSYKNELEEQLKQSVKESSALLSEVRRLQEIVNDQEVVIIELKSRIKSTLEVESRVKQIQSERDMLAMKLSEIKKANSELKQQLHDGRGKG